MTPQNLIAKYTHYVSAPPTHFIPHPSGSLVRRDFDDPPDMRERAPLSGETLIEFHAIADAIETAPMDSFKMIELGAGYGRWLVAAAKMAQRVRGLPTNLVGVEAERGHFQMMAQHFTDNGVDPTEHLLVEAAIGASDGTAYFTQGHSHDWWGQAVLPSPDYGFGHFPSATVEIVKQVCLATLLADVGYVDLIDLDIQGAESKVVASSRELLSAKVRRLHIGTHSAAIDGALQDTLSECGWVCIASYPFNSHTATPLGIIDFQDGAQTWTNPRVEQINT